MLTIEVEKTSDVAVVRCAGRLVRGAEVRTLRQAVVSENNTRIIMLDLSDVEAIDAGGLSALLSLRQWAWEHNVQLKLVNPSPFVQDVLARTKLDGIFDISRFDHALFVLSGCQHANYPARA
jgi:anti-anti-sigma factor